MKNLFFNIGYNWIKSSRSREDVDRRRGNRSRIFSANLILRVAIFLSRSRGMRNSRVVIADHRNKTPPRGSCCSWARNKETSRVRVAAPSNKRTEETCTQFEEMFVKEHEFLTWIESNLEEDLYASSFFSSFFSLSPTWKLFYEWKWELITAFGLVLILRHFRKQRPSILRFPASSTLVRRLVSESRRN